MFTELLLLVPVLLTAKSNIITVLNCLLYTLVSANNSDRHFTEKLAKEPFSQMFFLMCSAAIYSICGIGLSLFLGVAGYIFVNAIMVYVNYQIYWSRHRHPLA